MNTTTFRKMYTPEEIKAIAGGGGAGLEVIEITDVSETSTSGTLNEAQMAIVNSNTPSCVKFNNEYYYKNDDNHTDGITVYTHTGYTETDGGSIIKYFSITFATAAWTLTSTNLGKKLYMHKVIFSASSVATNVICDLILPTPTPQTNPITYFRKFKDISNKNYYNCNICRPLYGSDPIAPANRLVLSTYIEVTYGDTDRTPHLMLTTKDLSKETWMTDPWTTTTSNIDSVEGVAVIQL